MKNEVEPRIKYICGDFLHDAMEKTFYKAISTHIQNDVHFNVYNFLCSTVYHPVWFPAYADVGNCINIEINELR